MGNPEWTITCKITCTSLHIFHKEIWIWKIHINFDCNDFLIYKNSFCKDHNSQKQLNLRIFFHDDTHFPSFRASLEFYSQNLLTPELKVWVFLVNVEFLGCKFN